MGRAPCCEKESVKRGPWTPEEDAKLLACIDQHGVGNWRNLPKKAGLRRCGKSCRLRWTNYLRPDLKHGQFSAEEEQLIIRLHAALGSRWSLIAAQLPGRTDNDVKNYWNTRLKKKLCEMGIDPVTHKPISQLLADLARVQAGTLFPDQILPEPLHHLPPIPYPPITTTTTTTTTNSHLYQGRRTPTQIDLFQGGALGFFLSSTSPFPNINNTTTLNNTLPTTITTATNANANYIQAQHLLQLGNGSHAPALTAPMQTTTCKDLPPCDTDNRLPSHPSITTSSSCGSVHQLVVAPANSSSDGNYHDLLWESL